MFYRRGLSSATPFAGVYRISSWSLTYQQLCRNMQYIAQCAYRGNRQRALAGEHLGHAIFAAKIRSQIDLSQAPFFHAKAYGFNRAGAVKVKPLLFIVLDKFGEKFQTVTLW